MFEVQVFDLLTGWVNAVAFDGTPFQFSSKTEAEQEMEGLLEAGCQGLYRVEAV